MERIYHRWEYWEDYKAGFYENISGEIKKEKIEDVIRMFNDYELTKIYMERVITEWKYSCEHNLTNPSINKIAYIGQGACCIYKAVPATITMEAWSMLKKDVQLVADNIALNTLNKWRKANKQIQLCLSII